MAAPSQTRPQLQRRLLLARALQLGGLGLLAGCGLPFGPAASAPRTPGQGEPKSGGTLRIGKPEDILLTGFPHLLTPANFQICNLVYDTLVVYDQQLRPQPRLATSWGWSSDYRQLTFQLRQGVTFHTGRPFTSEDAKFNLERLRDPSIGSQLRNYAELMQVD